MLLASIILYLLLTVLIGFWASRRVSTSGDFMLAGRSLPLMLSSAAMFATWFGSETVFGASSRFLDEGLYGVIEDPFGAALCLLLFGLFFARKLYNMNLLTLGDYFKVRYGKSTELTASLFLAIPYTGYIAAQLVAMGLILSIITGIVLWKSILISACVVTLYTYVGGMWAISITDFIQSILIIFGLLVLAYILAEKAGGITEVMNRVPTKDLQFFPKFEFKQWLAYIAAWSALGLGSLPSQDVFQRSMSSSSARTAVYSCYAAAILYLTIAMLPIFISLCTSQLYGDQISGDTQLALPTMVLRHTTLPIQILFFGSLLSAIMSTASAAILAPASIFSENIVKPLLKQRLDDKHFLILTKVSVLIFALTATIMACLRSDISELVSESSVLSLVSLFIPLLLGLYWKKASKTGAMISMVAGMITWIIFEVFDKSWSSSVPATIVSLLGMVAGSLIWPQNETEYDQDRAEPIE